MAVASPSSRSQTSPRSYSSAFASTSTATFSSQAYSSLVSANVRVHGHRPSAFASTSTATFSSQAYSSSVSANVRVHGDRPSASSSVRLSVEQRPESPSRRSMTVTSKKQRNNNAVPSTSSEKRTCLCSPTTHPGSFRCAYHKQLAEQQQQLKRQQTASSKLNLLRSAMKNSLVRIGGVEGELVKRALTTLIRPSSQHLRRREAFQAWPSRLSLMSKSEDV